MHVLFIRQVAIAAALLTTVATPTPSQQQRADCGTRLSTFLTMVAGQDDPPDQRERFELHECPGRGFQLWAFERRRATPTLVSELFDVPVTLFQSLNVIAWQSVGGSSDHVYVYAFQKGRPRLIAQAATKGQMDARRINDEAVIQIPSTDYRTATASGRTLRYVVPIESRSPNNPSGR